MKHVFTWLGLFDQDGRRAWAFLSMLLGCGIMTAFAAAALLLVREDSSYVFWLGIAAHVQVLVALTGFTAMFIKRDISVSKDGASIKDKDDVQHLDK
jgi:hypothetical protein